MDTKSKRVFSSHGGNVVNTVTKTKVLEGITVLAANLTVGLAILLLFVLMGLVHLLIAKLLLVPMKSLIDFGKGNRVLK